MIAHQADPDGRDNRAPTRHQPARAEVEQFAELARRYREVGTAAVFSAIEGMGRGDDPRAYREIFPSYDTVVEDGLREDTVPAARGGASPQAPAP